MSGVRGRIAIGFPRSQPNEKRHCMVGLLGVMTAHGFAGSVDLRILQPAAKNASAVRMPDEFDALLSRSVPCGKMARGNGPATRNLRAPDWRCAALSAMKVNL